MMLRALIATASLGAAVLLPAQMVPLEPGATSVEPASSSAASMRLRIRVEAFDANGHRVPFDGVVTVVSATRTGGVPVRTGTSDSSVDVPLRSLVQPEATSAR